MINDKVFNQLKHLSCDALYFINNIIYNTIIQSAGERIFKIGEHLAKLGVGIQANGLFPFAL